MKTRRSLNPTAAALFAAVAFSTTIARAADPLPSWNDGPAKRSIITFVERVTKPGSPDFVPIPERIAVYDNDGTLWPIAAFGNSVGDQQMLEYTHSGSGARFGLLVLHDDPKREFPYGPARGLPNVKYGSFTSALEDHAKKDGWTVVSMKDDWKTVFGSEIIAIDILLQPDATMLQHSAANNARLLEVFPEGFALDETHTPHITMLQCFVLKADLEEVHAAAHKVLAAANVNAMKLEAFKYYYAPTGPTGVAGICAKPTPEILKLHADIIAAARPFMVERGPIGAFTAPHDDAATDAAIIAYVSTFVPKMSGENFNPHVSTGVAPKEYLDKMLAEPFETFTFSPAGAAVYQLGPFGTAAKKLKQWDPKT